MYHVFSLAIK